MAEWAEKIILGGHNPQEQLRASAEFRNFLEPLLDERLKHPRDDLMSTLLDARIHGKPMSRDHVIAFMLLMFPAGIDTTWLSIGSLFSAVLGTPGAKERLIAEPELRAQAVEEALRWEPPTPLIPRLTRRDIVLSGVRIPANSLTAIGIGAANREPGRFGDADPAIWDLDRNPQNTMAFGHGKHMCLGIHVARAELRVALDMLLEELPDIELVEPPRFVGAAIRGPQKLMVNV
jgi:cytochrome P450